MEHLFKAIYDEFDGDAPLKGAVTNLYLSYAPEKTAKPYIIYHLVASPPLDSMGGGIHIEQAWVQFSIFSDTATVVQCNGIFAKFIACFDWCTLTFTGGWAPISMQRTNSNLIRDEAGNWEYVLDYIIRYQK